MRRESNLPYKRHAVPLNVIACIPRERRTYLYSATMTSKVAKLQRASLKDPVKVEVDTKYKTVDTLLQVEMREHNFMLRCAQDLRFEKRSMRLRTNSRRGPLLGGLVSRGWSEFHIHAK